MPSYSITTTARNPIFTGDIQLTSLAFKNSSTTGIIYLKNMANDTALPTSSLYDISLSAGQSVGFTLSVDGPGIVGPWATISDTAGGVTLEILPVYVHFRVH